MPDVGLTHVALPVRDPQKSVAFYRKYAGMEVVHRRVDADEGIEVVWLSDRTRPFAIVLLQSDEVAHPLRPNGHLGVGCASRDDVDRLCRLAEGDGALLMGPKDSGYPVGYWALLKDPDGHTLEIAFGQEVGLTVEGE